MARANVASLVSVTCRVAFDRFREGSTPAKSITVRAIYRILAEEGAD